MLRTEILPRSGGPVVTSLGELWVWTDRLRLQCLSRERLAAGKRLIEAILAPGLRHREDRIEALPRQPQAGARRCRPALVTTAERGRWADLERQNCARHTDEWLVTPIRALDNLAPIEAVRTPEGRAKLAELLKSLDYFDEAARRRGEPPTMDVARIRRELDMPAPNV